MSEERKVVTILFCDLVGFTAASETADPEEVKNRLFPYHRMLSRELERYGGTVEKFIGDAVMAVFGAPTAHEDDPERAVRSGLRILDAIEELNVGDPNLQLEVRIGINTGETLVTAGPRPDPGTLMVTGDAVNTASRLQGVAPIGGVVVGERTYRATKDVFDYGALDPVALKGKSRPVPVWRALSARARFGVDVVRSMRSPLVGREADLTILRAAFEKSVADRSVQMVILTGEPGVGKSRLVAELMAVVDSLPGLYRWRQGRSLPYGDGVTFWALGEIVKAEAGILETDSLEIADGKLGRVVAAEENRAWLHQRLRPLVGVDAPEASRQENFTAWREFLEALADQQPSVFVFEDLHWADPALLEFIEYVTEFAEGVPMVLIGTTRPELWERVPPFAPAGRSSVRVNLSALNREDTARLTANLLDQLVLPADVQQAVVSRAGGNPLYAEEFVRLLRDTGILKRSDAGWHMEAGADIPVPSSVHDLLAARLDTLASDRKHLLQDASVIGKVFWAGAVAAMAGRSYETVEQALHELSRTELIRPSRTSSMEGDSEYAFSHVLVRDVCYGQIPRRPRADRHVAAAGWIEERAGDRVEDYAEILASHYVTALDLLAAAGAAAPRDLPVKAARATLLAGDRAMRTDVAAAERLYAEGLRLAPDDPTLLVRHAEALLGRVRAREAAAEFEQAIEGFLSAGLIPPAAKALARSGKALVHIRDPRASVTADEALRLLEPLGPSPELVDVLYERAASRLVSDDNEGVVADADRGLALAAELGLPEHVLLRGLRGYSRVLLGDPGGQAEAQDALDAAIDQGLGRDAGILYYNVCSIVALNDGIRLSQQIADKGAVFARSHGLEELEVGFDVFRLDRYVDGGDWDDALELAESLARRATQSEYYALPPRSARALVHNCRGDFRRAASDSEWLLAECRREGEPPQIAAIVLPIAARTRLGLGDAAGCLSLLREFDAWEGLRRNENFDLALAGTVRTAIQAGDAALGVRLLAQDPIPLTQARYSRASARAALDEALGKKEPAAEAYLAVAGAWESFGVPWEHAHALLGRGRCLLQLAAKGEAVTALQAAREVFLRLRARPGVAECDELIGFASAESS